MSQPQNWTVEQVGQSFLDYYTGSGYEQIPGSSLLSKSLPMTFVMSAGMVQFERLAPTARPGDKYVLIQNCFRHVDIERVRNSAFHLTLFQMPGAFQFGPVDPSSCIATIWRLLTQVYCLAPQNLYVTYFHGGRVSNRYVPAEKVTAKSWRSAGVPASHIIGLGTKDNFWRQSERMVGLTNSLKCGPNTEVFFDRGEEFRCNRQDCGPGCPCGRFVEFMNMLFICYRFDEGQNIVPLDEAFTEVVIGRERLAAVLNHSDSVYEVDTIKPLLQHVRAFSDFMPQGDDVYLQYQRTIVDHIRALLFLIQDGAPPPGKNGRERLMRILARELLTSQRLLGISDLGFFRSLTTLALELYPHLTSQTQRKLLSILAEEQAKFDATLHKSLAELEKQLEKGEVISPIEIVNMEKNRGIPFDLLSYRFWQKHVSIDMPAYQTELSKFLQAAKEESNKTGNADDHA